MHNLKDIHVLITVHRGITDQVNMFDDREQALGALEQFVKDMNPQDDDAGVYASNGLVCNAKHILDGEVDCGTYPGTKPIYINGNPEHWLGFMLVSWDDPLGFDEPTAALSELGQMRKDSGRHLKLYRVLLVDSPVAKRADLERYNAECEVEDFDYSLVEEYLC